MPQFLRRYRSLAAVLLVALAATFGPSLRGQPDAPKESKYALLIGVREHEHAALRSLRFTENDIEELAKRLDEPY